jgi:nucleotide-binding universal stress UspA family protein
MALSIARRAEATVHLVHVHQVVPPSMVEGVVIMDAIDLHQRQDETAYLADVARRVVEARPVMLRTALLDGEVVPALKEYAARNDIDLVVMSTHGRGALARFWLGSIADEAVGEMRQPVLLVRPEEGEPDLRREVPLKTILVPSDGTLQSETVLDPAMDLANLFGSTLDLLRVVQPALRPAYTPEGASVGALTHGVLQELREAQSKREKRARIYLDEVSGELKQQGYKVEAHAMETHARRGLPRMFLGSVADKVVRGGLVPVLLHHPPK